MVTIFIEVTISLLTLLIIVIFFQVIKVENERDHYRKCFEPLKKKLKEVEESESGMRIALEKAERDTKLLKDQNANLHSELNKAEQEVRKSETAFRSLDAKFKVCASQK